MFDMPIQQGWQCPACKRILSPYVNECSYCGGGTVASNHTEICNHEWDYRGYSTGGFVYRCDKCGKSRTRLGGETICEET